MGQSTTSNQVTEGIRIQTAANFIPERSRPEAREYLYTYHVIISNEGDQPAELLSRHWIVINADGEREEVKGPGVIGQNPLLKPTESFEYDSYCPLDTAWGTMEGSYQLRRPDGRIFDAHIGRFFLVQPSEKLSRSFSSS